jgi:hypothetical protein
MALPFFTKGSVVASSSGEVPVSTAQAAKSKDCTAAEQNLALLLRDSPPGQESHPQGLPLPTGGEKRGRGEGTSAQGPRQNRAMGWIEVAGRGWGGWEEDIRTRR